MKIINKAFNLQKKVIWELKSNSLLGVSWWKEDVKFLCIQISSAPNFLDAFGQVTVCLHYVFSKVGIIALVGMG